MLLIFGLDGATFNVIRPLVAEGRLPALGHMMREGAWGPLRSTTPPVTFPAWTSFMTAVNPGRHAIFDFSRREPGSYRVRFLNATHRKAPTIWRLMSDAGRRVAVLGLPGTYPPEPVAGVMVSGFDTPVTLRAGRDFCFPRELYDVIRRFGGFPFAEFQEAAVDRQWYSRALDSLLAGIERKVRLAKHLLASEQYDCFLLLFGESDTVSHHFWRFWDPESPRFEAQAPARLREAVASVYEALDAAVGEITGLIPDADVMVVSDHGFGGVGTRAVRINRRLASRGLLSWRAGRARGETAAGRLRRAALRWVPEGMQARLFRLGGGWMPARVETAIRFGGIDWSRTVAFSEELNYAPAVWLNVEGREPAGTVPTRDYEATREQVIRDLLAWRDPDSGEPVVARAWRREEVYRGPWVHLAPDILLELATPGGYSYVVLPSEARDGPDVEEVAAQMEGRLGGLSGSHRPDGVFLARGPHIRAGCVPGARIEDAGASALALTRTPLPADLDGRVLPCVTVPVEQGRPTDGAAFTEERHYSEAEDEEIARRLEKLGYLA